MHSLTHPKYRPDIDGLRAIAILFVVLFHIGITKGGFIGVDIFFVISGFLISSIIFNNLDSNSFSFWQFYERRVRRIFPALLVVFLFCLAFGWFVLFADEYKQLAKHVFRGSYFVSNFTLLRESGYFDNAAETKPLLHLWSLAIEEQFYIVWPLLVFLFWKKKKHDQLLKAIILIILASFVYGLWAVYHDKTLSFYSPLTRFWELLIGALLAYIKIYRKDFLRPLSHKKTNLISFIGITLIALAILFIGKDEPFPGPLALIPTIGTAMIIFAGKETFINQKILGNKVLIWFGMISYPLYLWHWPLISFAKIINGDLLSLNIKIALVALSIVLAFVTCELIEKPLRFGRNGKQKAIILLIGIIIASAIAYFIYKKQGLPNRSLITESNAALLKDLDFKATEKRNWICSKEEFKEVQCSSDVDNPDAVLIGDSHANSFYFGLKEVYQKSGLNLAVLSIAGCPAFLDLRAGYGTEIDKKDCSKRASSGISSILQDKNIKQVIIVNRGNQYTSSHDFGVSNKSKWKLTLRDQDKKSNFSNSEVFSIALEKTLNELTISGKKIVYLQTVADLGFDIRKCLDLVRPFQIKKKDDESRICANDKIAHDEFINDHLVVVGNVLKLFPNVKNVDASKYFCDDKNCYGIMDGKILYVDSNHLSNIGSEIIAEKIGKDLIKNFR